MFRSMVIYFLLWGTWEHYPTLAPDVGMLYALLSQWMLWNAGPYHFTWLLLPFILPGWSFYPSNLFFTFKAAYFLILPVHGLDDALVVEWWSLILWGDANSSLVPRRPTNGGGTSLPCRCIPSSPCVPVGRAGCTLLGGLVLRENLTVSGMGFVIVWKSSHDHGYTGGLLDVSHPYLNEIALSTR